MSAKGLVTSAVIMVTIGGTAYTVNQTDVIENFAEDTGMSQQEAEKYVKGVDESELLPYDEVGASYIEDGDAILKGAVDIDCDTYEYEWESYTLSCEAGKSQIIEIGNDEIALGNAYKRLGSASATRSDIDSTIRLIDEVNTDYEAEVVRKLMDDATITEVRHNNSYNKAMLEAALESGE